MSIRGAHNAEGKLVVVAGDQLYRITPAGVAIPLGALPGTGRVQLDHNQISLGNQVMAVNGSAGYLWNTVTNAYGRITDPGFPGGASVRFVSGYFVVIEPQGRYAASSAPADGTNWNTINRWTSEVSPDPLVAQGVRGQELLLLSSTSGEFFRATANAQQPFRTSRIDFKNVGAAGPHSVFEADGNIFWLGSDGVWYCLDGYSPRRISKRPQEAAIKGLNWDRAFAFRWDTVIYWTFPDGLTWGWDFAEREWHRRESPGLNRWRPNTMTRWDRRWIAGDFQADRLWDCNLEDRYYLEGDSEYIVRRTTGVLSDNQNRLKVNRLELKMAVGQPLTVPVAFPAQPDPPTISGDAPDGFVGGAYSFTYTLADGTPPYVVTLHAGTLPAGLSLSSAGVLSGTPTETGSNEFTVRVTDSAGLWDQVEDTVGITQAAWLAGPVNEDGAGGGDSNHYLRAFTVAGLFTATPIAAPAEGSGVIERISKANGRIFMHRATLACMSDDFGATWTACDNSLFGSSWGRDVYWNGANYYYGGVVSADGLAWTAIPNLPSGGRVQHARASDGRIVVQTADGVFHTSIDDGANWVTPGVDAGSAYSDAIAGDDEDYVLSSTTNNQYPSQDNLASVIGPTNGFTFSHFYANGAWFVIKYQSGDGIFNALGIGRTEDVATWPDLALSANFAFIEEGVLLDPNFMALNGAGEGVVWDLDGTTRICYATSDNGVTWASAGTLYGPVASIVGISE